MALQNQTTEQEASWISLYHQVRDMFGPEATSNLCLEINNWREDNQADWRAAYDYAIRKAKEKLSAPTLVLDDSEYHEIIKAQELME